VRDRGAQADSRGAAQVLNRDTHAVARGAACCASQELDRGTKAVASGAACCAPQESGAAGT
jgi:hypothetical protein